MRFDLFHSLGRIGAIEPDTPDREIFRPFGIVPRNELERALWPQVQRLAFLEAIEIFLRLNGSAILASDELIPRRIERSLFADDATWDTAVSLAREHGAFAGDAIAYHQRWQFEPLQLVPALPDRNG